MQKCDLRRASEVAMQFFCKQEQILQISSEIRIFTFPSSRSPTAKYRRRRYDDEEWLCVRIMSRDCYDRLGLASAADPACPAGPDLTTEVAEL